MLEEKIGACETDCSEFEHIFNSCNKGQKLLEEYILYKNVELNKSEQRSIAPLIDYIAISRDYIIFVKKVYLMKRDFSKISRTASYIKRVIRKNIGRRKIYGILYNKKDDKSRLYFFKR